VRAFRRDPPRRRPGCRSARGWFLRLPALTDRRRPAVLPTAGGARRALCAGHRIRRARVLPRLPDPAAGARRSLGRQPLSA
jgi:hypothetical protein